MLISIVHKLKVNVEVHVHVSNLQLSVTLYTSILKLVCACIKSSSCLIHSQYFM